MMVVQNTEIILNVKSLLLYELGLFVFNFNNKMLAASFYECFKSIKNINNNHTRSSETNFF